MTNLKLKPAQAVIVFCMAAIGAASVAVYAAAFTLPWALGGTAALMFAWRYRTSELPYLRFFTSDGQYYTSRALVRYRVTEPLKAAGHKGGLDTALAGLLERNMRALLCTIRHDDILANSQDVSRQLLSLLEAQTENWGIKLCEINLDDAGLKCATLSVYSASSLAPPVVALSFLLAVTQKAVLDTRIFILASLVVIAASLIYKLWRCRK